MTVAWRPTHLDFEIDGAQLLGLPQLFRLGRVLVRKHIDDRPSDGTKPAQVAHDRCRGLPDEVEHNEVKHT